MSIYPFLTGRRVLTLKPDPVNGGRLKMVIQVKSLTAVLFIIWAKNCCG